jgi:hypothetical protein
MFSLIGFGALSDAFAFEAAFFTVFFFGAAFAGLDFAAFAPLFFVVLDRDDDFVLAGGLLAFAAVGVGVGAVATGVDTGIGVGMGVGAGGVAAPATSPAWVAVAAADESFFGSGVSFPPVNSPAMKGLAMHS